MVWLAEVRTRLAAGLVVRLAAESFNVSELELWQLVLEALFRVVRIRVLGDDAEFG